MTSMEHGRESLTHYYTYASFLFLSHALSIEVMPSSFVQSRARRCFATKQSMSVLSPLLLPPPLPDASCSLCACCLTCVRDSYDILCSSRLAAMRPICIPLLKEKTNKGTRLQSYETVEFDPACTHMHKHTCTNTHTQRHAHTQASLSSCMLCGIPPLAISLFC